MIPRIKEIILLRDIRVLTKCYAYKFTQRIVVFTIVMVKTAYHMRIRASIANACKKPMPKSAAPSAALAVMKSNRDRKPASHPAHR